jgi:hypothetical protein
LTALSSTARLERRRYDSLGATTPRRRDRQRQQSHDHPRHVVRRKTTEPHIDVITLAVGDLDRSLAFYRDGLGLETSGVVASQFVDDETNTAGAIVIFGLRGTEPSYAMERRPSSSYTSTACDFPFSTGEPKVRTIACSRTNS